MSKVKVSFELELPEFVPIPELNQIIFDAITNYACVKHGLDAMHWMVKASEEKPPHRNFDIMVGYHKEWQRILSDVQIKIDVL